MPDTDEGVLGRDEFVSRITIELPTEVIEGCRIRALSAAAYQRLQGIRLQAALGGKADEREEIFRVVEMAAWLALGVIDPQISVDEWRHLMERSGSGVLGRLVQRIREITNAVDADLELAKKVLPDVLNTLQSLPSQ